MNQLNIYEMLNESKQVIHNQTWKIKAIRRDAPFKSKHKQVITNINPNDSDEMYKTYRSWIWNN